MKSLIGIIAGDPESINSEILAKVWKNKKNFKNVNIFVIGNYNLIKSQFKVMKIKIDLKKFRSFQNNNFKKKLMVYDIPLIFKNPFKIKKKSKSKYVIRSFNTALKFIKSKKIKGLINCPINKKEIFKNNNIGVTEFLAKKTDSYGKEAMVIYNKKLSVSPITTHIQLKKVSKNITKNKIIKRIVSINKFFIQKLKFKPQFGVLGLNPHNDEFRKNSEENKIIKPAISKLKKMNIKVKGPISADTAFVNFNKKGINVLIGMYHDQVLGPFKALYKFNAINITTGLPFLRISPDHGTGKDIIKKNQADPTSLMDSIKFFSK